MKTAAARDAQRHPVSNTVANTHPAAMPARLADGSCRCPGLQAQLLEVESFAKGAELGCSDAG